MTMVIAGHATHAAPRPQNERPFTVVIDPGHGGDNLGCLAFDGETREKTVTLAIGRHLVAALAQNLPHANVILTRNDDRYMPLAARVVLANDAQADLFISLHANASPSRAQQGFETWVLDASLAERDAAWLSKTTERAGRGEGAHGNGPAARMIDHLSASAHRQQALWFAQKLQREHAARFPRRPNRGVRAAAFDVLVGLRMPAVLHEFGFLDHPEDGALLLDAEAQAQFVEALTQSIAAYYRLLAYST
jgi:N-acetylmuramoyl-L-alanine amidase